MGRNRVIYQSEALFVKEISEHNALNSTDQLLRVQDISHGVELNRTDVNEFGQLSAIERPIIEPPTVSLEFSYYLHGGNNEELIGFEHNSDRGTASSAGLVNGLKNFLSNDSGKNYYIGVSAEGDDLKGTNAGEQQGVIGIGNGYISNYSVEAAVGDMPTASVSVEANNIRFNATGTDIPNPAINLNTGANYGGTDITSFPQASRTGTKSSSGDFDVACLRPGDVIVDFNDAGHNAPSSSGAADYVQSLGGARIEGDGQCHLQNFTVDVPMARTALTRLGNRFPYAREIEVPMNITFSCSAFLADIEEGNLNALVCNSAATRNIRVKMLEPCLSSGEPSTRISQEFLIKGAELESQSFSNSIGENKTVDLVFSVQLSGANATDKGLFMWKGESFSASEASENPRG